MALYPFKALWTTSRPTLSNKSPCVYYDASVGASVHLIRMRTLTSHPFTCVASISKMPLKVKGWCVLLLLTTPPTEAASGAGRSKARR